MERLREEIDITIQIWTDLLIRKLGKSLGGEITAAYYTMGQYDMVVIMEAPSNEAAMEGLLKTGSLGNVNTETLVAIPAEKAVEIMGITFSVS